MAYIQVLHSKYVCVYIYAIYVVYVGAVLGRGDASSDDWYRPVDRLRSLLQAAQHPCQRPGPLRAREAPGSIKALRALRLYSGTIKVMLT